MNNEKTPGLGELLRAPGETMGFAEGKACGWRLAAFLALVRGALVNSKWHDIDGTCGRPVEDGCECSSCWVRRGGFNRPPSAR